MTVRLTPAMNFASLARCPCSNGSSTAPRAHIGAPNRAPTRLAPNSPVPATFWNELRTSPLQPKLIGHGGGIVSVFPVAIMAEEAARPATLIVVSAMPTFLIGSTRGGIIHHGCGGEVSSAWAAGARRTIARAA